MSKKYKAIITCEHATNFVPKEYKYLFQKNPNLLNTHRGMDFGAIEIAKKLHSKIKTNMYYGKVTRLLADLNRSTFRDAAFSKYVSSLSKNEKKAILEKYYYPYRRTVENKIESLILRGYTVVHLSMHSFTPSLHGTKRKVDIGFLYNPKRASESNLARRWKKHLTQLNPALNIRYNYPYLGITDGFTSSFRKIYPQSKYIGIEVEINQKFPSGNKKKWTILQKNIIESFNKCFI